MRECRRVSDQRWPPDAGNDLGSGTGGQSALCTVIRQRRLHEPDADERNGWPFGKPSHRQWQQFGQVMMSGQIQQQSLRVADDSG